MASRNILPSYLSHAVWHDYADALDMLLAENVAGVDQAIANARHMFPGNVEGDSALAEKVNARQLLSPSDYDSFSRDLEVQRLNTLGLTLTDPQAADESALARLTQNIGQYWYGKGTADLSHFLSFCLNSPVRLVPLWTINYKDFFEEGNPVIGTPIWDGGLWYPTSHVRLYFDLGAFVGNDFSSLVSILYNLINYNLVIEAYVTSLYFVAYSDNNPTTEPYVTDGDATVPWPAPIWQMGLVENVSLIIYPTP